MTLKSLEDYRTVSWMCSFCHDSEYFLANRGVAINQPPSSPDLASADYFTFHEDETVLSVRRFLDVENIT